MRSSWVWFFNAPLKRRSHGRTFRFLRSAAVSFETGQVGLGYFSNPGAHRQRDVQLGIVLGHGGIGNIQLPARSKPSKSSLTKAQLISRARSALKLKKSTLSPSWMGPTGLPSLAILGITTRQFLLTVGLFDGGSTVTGHPSLPQEGIVSLLHPLPAPISIHSVVPARNRRFDPLRLRQFRL